MPNQTSGNYIHQLQMCVRWQTGAINNAYEAYMDLVQYLYSTKFNEDTTVQVSDVLRRIQPIASALLDGLQDPIAHKLTKPVIATGEVTML